MTPSTDAVKSPPTPKTSSADAAESPTPKTGESEADGVFGRLSELAWQALPAIGSAAGFVGFVAVIGAAIEWFRFKAADLPATQALLAVPRQELVVVGALALCAFVGGALIAVLLVYLLDSRGDATVATVRGIIAVGFVEMVVTLFFIDLEDLATYFALGLWLAVIGLAAVDVVGVVTRFFGKRSMLKAAREQVVEARESLATAADALKVVQAATEEAAAPPAGWFRSLLSELRTGSSDPPSAAEPSEAEANSAATAAQIVWREAVVEWVELVRAISPGVRSPWEGEGEGATREEGRRPGAASREADSPLTAALSEVRGRTEPASSATSQQSLLKWCAARKRRLRQTRAKEASEALAGIAVLVNGSRGGGSPDTEPSKDEPIGSVSPGIPNRFELEVTLDRAESARDTARRAVYAHLCEQAAALRKRLKESGDGYRVIFVLAVVGLVASSVVQIASDKSIAWLSIELAVVAVLAMTNVFVARATTKFAWYGVSVFFTVLMFGATVTIARTLVHPKVQPIALVRTSDDVGICGVYVTQTSDRIYIGRLDLHVKERKGQIDSPRQRPGLIFWVPTKDVDLISVGHPESVDETFGRRARSMLDQLYKDRAEEPAPASKSTKTTEIKRPVRKDKQTTTSTTTIVKEDQAPKAPPSPHRHVSQAPPASCTPPEGTP